MKLSNTQRRMLVAVAHPFYSGPERNGMAAPAEAIYRASHRTTLSLQRKGLIEIRTQGDYLRGEPNRWAATVRGIEVAS